MLYIYTRIYNTCIYRKVYHNYEYTVLKFLVTLDILSREDVTLFKQFYYILLYIHIYCVFVIRFTARKACNWTASEQ